jgi:cytochrome c553
VRRVSSFPLMFALGLAALGVMGAAILFLPVPKPEVAERVNAPAAPSTVAWTAETIALANGGDVVRGMVVARRCEKCHGEEGFSDTGEVPNLASMDRLAFWKEMEDFRAAKRNSPLMQPQAAVLTAQDEADLAAYYAMLPAIPDPQDTRVKPPAQLDPAATQLASRLVTLGDGTRGIPPCQACHGPVGNVRGAPSLATQNADYISDQLDNFAAGSRANDINLPMRTIAAQLTPEERKALGEYYGTGLGSRPGAANPNWKK